MNTKRFINAIIILGLVALICAAIPFLAGLLAGHNDGIMNNAVVLATSQAIFTTLSGIATVATGAMLGGLLLLKLKQHSDDTT